MYGKVEGAPAGGRRNLTAFVTFHADKTENDKHQTHPSHHIGLYRYLSIQRDLFLGCRRARVMLDYGPPHRRVYMCVSGYMYLSLYISVGART